MKEVFAFIENKKQEFAQLPFFEFLRDQDIDPRYRMSFAPCFTPFVMGFAEFNKYVWREEPTDDLIQAIVNQYTYEDEHHWIWFLEDLQALDFNLSLEFNDFLRFIWSNETQISRQTVHEIYRYTYQARPIHKLAVIQAIEEIADIFLSTTTKVTEELKLITNREYMFFGNCHVESEAGHTIHSSKIEELLANINLTEEEIEELCGLVNKTFELFHALVDELLVYTINYNKEIFVLNAVSDNQKSLKYVHQ